jgi:alpha-D-xyloside xylohydrolase
MTTKKINGSMFIHINAITKNITRIVYDHSEKEPANSILISDDFRPDGSWQPGQYELCGGRILFRNRHGEAVLQETGRELTEKEVFRYYMDGEPIVKYKQTANGEVAYVENIREVPDGTAFEGKLVFSIAEDEGIYGLGQHEDGIYNYNGRREYLYQTNMKISIPFILSERNYGILIDTESAALFDCTEGKISIVIDTTKNLSYYVITGDSFDEIIGHLRDLTGRSPMLPRWAFGYVQSKERYRSSQELIDTVSTFRKSGIPIDCIVQDWFSWEEGLWGEKKPDRSRYPDLKALTGKLHENNVKLMVSIWPNMAEKGSNFKEFSSEGKLLPNSTTYDAFDEEARSIYWKQCNEEWFSSGVDAWWCDNTEPFSDADWNGEVRRPEELRYRIITDESRKHMDWTRLNTYGLLHSRGIYENWRKTDAAKRVVNLTRSSYISGQRYGAVCWSGDISAKWSTLRNQITEGIKFCMSGMPFWTLDIGAFFTCKDKWENRGCGCSGNSNKLWYWDGDYNDGVKDPGYRELYVRWLQYAAFLPMFRSHGTDTPREPWNFGSPGDVFYDTILKFIHLRYRLIPYIYSLAADVHFSNAVMLRSLLFDFAGDENVRDIGDSFMFGKAFLVCPVTEPMYYGADGEVLCGTEKTKSVYLPKGAVWYDFWTNAVYAGGQVITCDAALETMPLFVRSGSIIPVSDPIMYADERKGEAAEILVYAGADGEFTLYNDEGDNYSYENGNFSAITLTYREEAKELSFGAARGSFPFQTAFRITLIGAGQSPKTISVDYSGSVKTVRLI